MNKRSTLEKNRPPRVLIVGDVMVDHYLQGKTERVSPEAPVVVVEIEKEQSVLGGAGNVAANLSALDAVPLLCGVVGQDAMRDTMVRLLAAQHVIDCLVEDADRPTTAKNRIMSMSKQVLRYDYESKKEISTLIEQAIIQQVQQGLMEGVAAIVLSDYAKGVLTHALCQQIISAARQSNVPVLVDPKGTQFEKYTGATLLTPNRKELELAVGEKITDRTQLIHYATQLRMQLQLDALVVTLSEDGLAIFTEGQSPQFLKTEAREVFDVTGAGDTVLAALTYALSTGTSLYEAAKFANTAAAVVVSKIGSATATHDEIAAFTERQQHFSRPKLLSLPELCRVLQPLKQAGKTVVFTNGCFDLLHHGHVHYLAAAKMEGDVLVVGLNSDTSVKRLKGPTRPINHEIDRAVVLSALAAVDYVVIFEEDTPLQVINAIEPDVLVKGGDYQRESIVGFTEVIARGGRVEVKPFVDGKSTTHMIEKMRMTDE